MAVVIVTGSAGLIGSETAKYFHAKGLEVIGIDNDMRKYFFGKDSSTVWNRQILEKQLPNYRHHSLDIRDQAGIDSLFKQYGNNIKAVIHCAAQPSHDWAAKEPLTDFHINATGTLNCLESTRLHCPDAAFIHCSTNKVYGDSPNLLPLIEQETRWEIDSNHPYFQDGIDEHLTIDQSKHSIFGASKAAGDILVQEYGRYFGMNTATFRGGCLTGPAHSGAELHGFLAWLVKCAVTGQAYTIFGYKGKQVRDNIHSYDLVNAFYHYFEQPRPGEVYNIGGSRFSNCSVLEAIQIIKELAGYRLNYTHSDKNREGDHIWWISDINKFKEHYPQWNLTYDIRRILQEIIDATIERQKQ